METLKNFKLDDLFKVLALPDNEFEKWLKELKLLHTTRFCDCGKEMSYKWIKGRQQPLWICTSVKNHDGKQRTVGFYTGTFFEGAHLTPKQVFKFSYYWAHKFGNDQIMFQMELGSATVTDWKNYTHYVVNHSEHFKDPVTGQHTNTIESTWQKFKQQHKTRFGTQRSLFSTYISDFLWRKQFGGPDIFYNLWTQIAELYPIIT